MQENVIRSVSKILRNTSIRYRLGLVDISTFRYMNNIHENMFFIATFLYWHPIGLIFYIFSPLSLVFCYLLAPPSVEHLLPLVSLVQCAAVMM